MSCSSTVGYRERLFENWLYFENLQWFREGREHGCRVYVVCLTSPFNKQRFREAQHQNWVVWSRQLALNFQTSVFIRVDSPTITTALGSRLSLPFLSLLTHFFFSSRVFSRLSWVSSSLKFFSWQIITVFSSSFWQNWLGRYPWGFTWPPHFSFILLKNPTCFIPSRI